MKNKKTFRLAAFMLVLIMITVAMLSGTFAKYSSEFKGSDSALIAKWDVDFNGSTGGAVTLDLFAHEYDKHILQTDGTDYIIAPGVKGDFTFEVTNSSDVKANVTFEIAKVGADVPLSFKVNDGSNTSTVTLGALQTTIQNAFGTLDFSDTKTVTVDWEWPYEGANLPADDVTDTGLGTDSTTANRTNYTLIVTATAIQIAPTE